MMLVKKYEKNKYKRSHTHLADENVKVKRLILIERNDLSMKKELNKKGFTVVELIVSFSLALVIAVFLFQIIINLKNLYTNSVTKTELVNIQSLISRDMNKNFKKTITNINDCGNKCAEFIYQDGTSDKLEIGDNSVMFGNYKTKLPEQSYIKNPSINIASSGTFEDKNNSLLIVEVPLFSETLNQEFNIKIIYQFNSNKYNLNSVDLAN